MNKSANNAQWFHYQELPIRESVPVKLDVILARRMAAFLETKNDIILTKES